MIPVDPKIAIIAGELANEFGPIALDKAKEKFTKYINTNHGSKVKMGEFADAKIDMFGDKACIKLSEDGRQFLLLTSDNIRSYKFVKEKKKLAKGKLRTYFYYNITFTDGSESYVRMRRKYAQAMERYTGGVHNYLV